MCVCVCVCTHALSCVRLFATLWTLVIQALLFMGFPSWNGLPFPTPGDIPNPGIELVSLVSPALQVDSLPLRHQGGPIMLEGEFRESSSGLF